jgi:hypothetical protein
LALIKQCHGLCIITNSFENARYLRIDANKLFEPTYCYKHYNLPNCITYTKRKKKDDKVCMATLNTSCSELKCSNDQVRSVCLNSTSYLQVILQTCLQLYVERMLRILINSLALLLLGRANRNINKRMLLSILKAVICVA